VEEPLLVTLEAFTAQIESNRVRLTWSTATEIDNVGFRILRQSQGKRLREGSELELLTPTLIPASGAELLGAEYQFVDADPPPGRIAYFLEDVDRFGRSTRHGPVVVDFHQRRLGPAREFRRGRD
jgi:hypothetical protein